MNSGYITECQDNNCFPVLFFKYFSVLFCYNEQRLFLKLHFKIIKLNFNFIGDGF